MRALVLMHHPDEGPDSIGKFLLSHSVELEYVRLYDGDALPPDPSAYDAVVAMGGPMNVYETDEHPWLEPEDEFLRRALAAGVPMLGVCLGAQLFAKALDASVTKNPVGEHGWFEVALTSEAASDPLMAGVEPVFQAFHWHNDTFAIPQGAVHLATSADCVNQAFRHGNAWALQFHVEATAEVVATWVKDNPNASDILAGFATGPGPQMAAQGQRMFENFLGVMQQRSVS